PTDEIVPMPVTTTRSWVMLKKVWGQLQTVYRPFVLRRCRRCYSLRMPVLDVSSDVLDRFTDSGDFFSVFVGNLHPELFFEGHDQFDRVERISTDVLCEACLHRYFLGTDVKLFHGNLYYSLEGFLLFHEYLIPPYPKTQCENWCPLGPPRVIEYHVT